MDARSATDRSSGDRGRLWRAVLSLVAGAGLAYLLLVAAVLAAITCDDTCGGADPDDWRWTAQLVLAAVACVLGAVALLLGFTSRTLAYRVLLAAAVGCVVAWLLWVLGFGAF